MGTRNRIKGPALVSAAAALAALVMLLLGAAAALVAPGASASRGGSLCPPGKQFWDAAEERCRDCSVCREPRHFVLRACHVLADTKCGYARELVMGGRVRPRHHSAAPSPPPTTTPASPTHPAGPVSTGVVVSAVPAERGVHRPRGRWGTELEGGGVEGESGERGGHWPAVVVRRMHKHRDRTNNNSSSSGHNHHLKKYRDYLFHHHHHHRQKARPPESAAQMLGRAEGGLGGGSSAEAATAAAGGGGGGAASTYSVAAATASAAAVATGAAAAGVAGLAGQPLSTAEELAWDWQVAVLVAAVAACALFFGAAALHGFRQLRQDARRSADADNLSATLSLMVPELINDIPYSCSVDGHSTNQCLYIEQLLVRKNEESKEGQGNVYIDRGKGKMHE